MKNWLRRWLGLPVGNHGYGIPVPTQWSYDAASGNITAVPVINANADLNVTVSRISNGYIVSCGSIAQPVQRQYYAPDLKEVGEYITAQAVAQEIKGK
jgi:hypothetical protein